MEELEKQLGLLLDELKGYKEEAKKQEETVGSMTKTLTEKIDAVQKQVDAIDERLTAKHQADTAMQTKSIRETLEENDHLAAVMRTKNGNAHIELSAEQVANLFERKTTILGSNLGSQTTGVLPIERDAGIVAEARQRLFIRDVLAKRATSRSTIDFVKVLQNMVAASPQTEGSAKVENWLSFVAASQEVRTIATWIPASKQVLDDMDELMAFIQSSLVYYVNLEEELQLLSGDNTGQNLNGLITQATAFDTSLLLDVDGWNRIDIVGRAIQQINTSKEIAPTFIVVHPTDWWNIRLTKDSYGRYILGDPQGPPMGMYIGGGELVSLPGIFGLAPIVTTNITAGTFLVGSGASVATEIRDRMGMSVEVATQHSDYFTKNLIAVRAEKRLALVTKRPASFITGSFSVSPS